MARSNIQRTYYARIVKGEAKALFMSQKMPGAMEDFSITPEGWKPTHTLIRWRGGEENYISQITRKEAKEIAGKGSKYVK